MINTMEIIFFSVGTVWAYMLMNSRRSETSGQGLTVGDLIQVVIMNLICPLFSGLIMYYGWRKNLPKKAHQVSILASIIFIGEVVLIVVPIVLSSWQMASLSAH